MMEVSISSLPSIFQRRCWPAIATFVAAIGGAIIYLQVTPPMYKASVRVMVNDKQVSVSDLGRDLTQQSSAAYANPLATQIELAKSQRVLHQALAQVSFQGVSDVPEAENFRKELKASIVPATDILELSYQNQNPLLTAVLLNALAEAMVQENAATLRAEARSVRQFLAAELPQQRQLLTQAEAAESQYKKSSSVVSLTEQTKALVTSLADLEDQERALAAQIQEARTRDSLLQQTTDSETLKQTYDIVRGGQDEELKRLRNKLAELESEVAVKRVLLTDNHPSVVTLIQQRDATRNLYTQKLSALFRNQTPANPDRVASAQVSQELASKLILGEIERSALEAKLEAVRQARANLQTRINQLPNQEQALAALARRREEIAASVKLLQQRLEEARIAEAQLTSNLTIIDRAEPPQIPNSPRKAAVLVIASAAGLILAVGIVLLLEVLDGTLRNATEAEKLLRLPVLGVLPILPRHSLSPEKAELFLDNFRLVESYRMLLKTIEFRSEGNLQVLVVSSTLSGEGKSVVVAHLAAVAAMLSRRTLIVDADMRRPTQHKIFNLAAQPGLTDVVAGVASFSKAVQRTHIDRLSVMTCGKPTNRCSQLLESAVMHNLIREATTRYDLIVIDTPPVTSCVDATTLSRNSKGLLLVARPNLTQREILLRAVSELNYNQVPIIGVAVNGINPQTEKYYKYAVEGYQPKVKRLNS